MKEQIPSFEEAKNPYFSSSPSQSIRCNYITGQEIEENATGSPLLDYECIINVDTFSSLETSGWEMKFPERFTAR